MVDSNNSELALLLAEGSFAGRIRQRLCPSSDSSISPSFPGELGISEMSDLFRAWLVGLECLWEADVGWWAETSSLVTSASATQQQHIPEVPFPQD
jgi:hypothetical protein